MYVTSSTGAPAPDAGVGRHVVLVAVSSRATFMFNLNNRFACQARLGASLPPNSPKIAIKL